MMNQEKRIIKTKETQEIAEININQVPTEKETIACLLSLLESLSYEICSSDVWWLAKHSATKRAIKDYGVDENVFNNVMERFEKVRKANLIQ